MSQPIVATGMGYAALPLLDVKAISDRDTSGMGQFSMWKSNFRF